MKPAHTPEPWVYTFGAVYMGSDPNDDRIRLLLADRDTPATRPVERDANCARAVACVNAFAGVDDPAAELARLRAIETAARVVLDALDSGSDRPSLGPLANLLYPLPSEEPS